MNTFTYEIHIKAKTQSEAETKLQAMCDLLSNLNEKELAKLAHIVKNDPIKTAMAKRALGV